MVRMLLALFCLSLAVAPTTAEGDAKNGKKLAKKWECTGCHGISGNNRSSPKDATPMLAGQPVGFLVKRMIEYKAGLHDDLEDWSRMKNLIDGLNDQDISDIAAHFASQKRY